MNYFKYQTFFLSLFIVSSLNAATINKIDFVQDGEVSKVIVNLDTKSVQTQKFHVEKDKQIILDIENVDVDAKTLRAFDTSEFPGSVVYVSPYKKPGTARDIRIAIQLRDNVRSILESEDNSLVLKIENRFGVFSQANINTDEQSKTGLVTGQTKIHVPKSDSVEDILENLTHSGRKRYIGKRIALDVRNIAVPEILKMIADASGFNLILGDEVNSARPLTLQLTNIPWDQALDTILDLSKLVAVKNGNILMITTLEKATAERKLKLEAEALRSNQEPLVTKIFRISFAEVGEITAILQEYLTPDRGRITVDNRTNSLIVKDTPDIIEKLKKIVETLDTQTPQVLIEAKVVEASESFNKQIGLQDGLTFGYDPVGDEDAVEVLDGITPTTGSSFSFSSAPLQAGRNLLGISIGVYKRLKGLSFNLQLMENESKGKVISTPKVITQNKKAASIVNDRTTSYKQVTVSDGGTTESYGTVSARLSLNVTPQVTNEGSIIMQVDLNKGSFSNINNDSGAPPDIINNSVTTNVLVDNGSTIVIGGVYSYTESESHSGIPYLKDLPLIGWLFRTLYNPSKTKDELIIFLTPRIINQEEAGLVDEDSLG